MTPREEAIALPGLRGELRGIRHAPAGADTGWSAIVLQGFYSSTHVGPARLYVQLGRLLAARGIEVLRVDPVGVGDSDGDFAQTTYASELADYRIVVAHAKARARRVALVGHCLGAGMAVRIAADDPAVGRLLLISPGCGPFSTPENHFSEVEYAELARTGRTVRKAVPIAREFVEAIQDPSIYEVARRVRIPCLLLHSGADEYFDGASARRLAACLPGAEVVELAAADHNFLARGCRERLLEEFARRIGAMTW